MLDLVLIAIAVAMGGGQGGAPDAAPVAMVTPAPGIDPEAETRLMAEVQTPTGKFTTATEVRPILDATKGSWVGLRDYDGQDLIYVTHLLAWRCGLAQLRYGVNGAPLQVWDMPRCYHDTAMPNAIKGEDALPFVAHPGGSVQQIEIELTYDDLSVDTVVFQRSDVLMP